AARRRSRSAPRDHGTASAIRAARLKGSRVSAAVSLARPPIQVSAHARPQLWYLIDGIGSDRKCAQIEIARRACCAPARIFALGCDQLDLNGDAAVGERGNAHVETIAHLDGLDEVLPQVEMNPQVVEIDQGH